MPKYNTEPLNGYRWTKATFLGWLLGIILIILLSSLLDAIGIGHLQCYIGIGMGTGIGYTQWLLLNRKIGMSTAWITITFAGMGIPFVLLDLVLPDAAYKLPAGVVLGGHRSRAMPIIEKIL